MLSPANHLPTIFAALADPTRRAILKRLSEGEAPVGELARPFDMSAPAISKHLRVLVEAGLIERQVSARWRICHLRADALQDAHDWLSIAAIGKAISTASWNSSERTHAADSAKGPRHAAKTRGKQS